MLDQPAVSFAELLRRLRLDAGMTQEGLAQATGLSTRAISDLERAVNLTARRETARLLADALNLDGAARAGFMAASRGRMQNSGQASEEPAALARSIAATTPQLPRDIRNFIGREPDLGRLIAQTRDGGVVGIYAIDGMAGVGKSTFAVHAAHLLAPEFPDGQIFLQLHAHTAGHRPVDPVDALASLLLTVGVQAHQIPAGLQERASLWRSHLAGRRVLLLLDDAAGHDQVRPLLPGTPGSLVLITSRRHLAALDDATSLCLDVLPDGDAAAMLIRLADRTDLDAADPAVGTINDLCGSLPLAIAMLGRQLHHHPAWTVAGLAAYLAAARDRLELMHAENLSVAAAFDLSYLDLTPDQQRLFRRLGLHPGTDIDSHAAAALDDCSLDTARRHLDDLFDQHLVTEPANGRYRMHDLIRRHARTLAEADSAADNEAATRRLIDYYVSAATAIGQHFHRGDGPAATSSVWLPELAARADAAAWMEAERANMHAVVDLAAQLKWPDPGIKIVSGMSEFLRTHGHWTQMKVLHLTVFETARQAGHRSGEIYALTSLGYLQRLTGDYMAAAATLAQAMELSLAIRDPQAEANVLTVLGVLQRLTVDFPTAIATLTRALRLQDGTGDKLGQVDALNELGNIRRLAGDYAASKQCHDRALQLSLESGDRLGQADSLRYLGRAHYDSGDHAPVGPLYSEALTLYQELEERAGLAHGLNYLGVAQRGAGDFAAAEQTQKEALALYRELNHRLGQTEALNNLGELLSGSDPAAARAYHDQALAMASRMPALYEQARALEGIGNSYLHDRSLRDHADGYDPEPLRQALEIYRRLGARRAAQVEQTLRARRP
jgi:tetratricopeptide (TPR) repeat protein/transcriptional regulator with XRE-family HTH domain